MYLKYEEDSYNRILKLIQNLNHPLLPQSMFITFINRIYKRKS